jgi:hypothetical protein
VATPTRPAERIASRSSAVRLLPTLPGCQDVRRLEEPIVDLFALDEAADVDRARLLERRRTKVLFGQDDEAPLLVFVALDQAFPGDRFTLAHAYALELHGRLVVGVEQPELRS